MSSGLIECKECGQYYNYEAPLVQKKMNNIEEQSISTTVLEMRARVATLENAVEFLTEKIIALSVAENAYISIISQAKKIYDDMVTIETSTKRITSNSISDLESMRNLLYSRFDDIERRVKKTLVEMAIKNGVTVKISAPEAWLDKEEQ